MSVLVVESVHKSFREGFWGRRKRVLEGVSLSVEEGEVYGFLGHNGAGKSTTMKVILGLARADAGRVEILGERPENKRIRDRVGFLSEEIGLYPHMTADENLSLVGQLHRLRGARLRGRIDELVAAVGLADARGVKVKDYSKGMRQRLGIAAALMNDPDLLLLDEPYSGLDPVGRKDLRGLLLALKAEGKTIMLSSHIVPDVEAVCDRVGILSRGTIARELDLRKVFDGTGKIVEVTVSGLTREGIDPDACAAERIDTAGDRLVVRCPGDERLKALFDDVYAASGSIVEVRRLRPNLEEVFVEEIDRGATGRRGTPSRGDSMKTPELVHSD